MANLPELDMRQRQRYSAVYCGICRGIRSQCSQACGLALSYDMAFLSLLLMSLYEPEETGGDHACLLHPGRSWTDNKFIRYGADMNVALAYYNALDDYEDEGRLTAKLLCNVFGLPVASDGLWESFLFMKKICGRPFCEKWEMP